MAGKQLTASVRIARFWSYVDKSPDPAGCWVWTGYRMPRGYGNFQSRNAQIGRLAHRYAYATFIGPIPEGLDVLHRCDNPPCVRPDHLFLGTAKDNMADASAKGRMDCGDTPRAMKLRNRGRRLTPDDVRVIRRTLSSRRGPDVTRSLATAYGVSYQLIWQIRRRIAWRHLPEMPT